MEEFSIMLIDKVRELVTNKENEMIDFRRDLHKNPELSMQEFETSKKIAKELEKMGIKCRLANPTGVIAEIEGAKKGKTVLLRADIDALPIKEENEIEYKSINEDISHACGHDTHAAMLLNAAYALNELRNEFNGTVRLLFQPGEETGEGSVAMVRDGAIDGVDNAFGAHIFTIFKTGEIGATTGQTFAANNFVTLTFKGLTTHGSTPQKGVDALIMASSFIMNAQNIISREIDLLEEPAVLTFGKINGGEVANSVCGEVKIEGGFRAFTTESVKFVIDRIKTMANDIAKMYGGEVEIETKQGAAPVFIDENSGKLMQKVAAEIVGEENVKTEVRFSGSEDFGLYLEGFEGRKGVPGAYAIVGAKSDDDERTHKFNHASDFFIDESAMKNGAMMYVLYAIDYLNQDEF